jgi:signal transduction histidine kinase
MRENDSVPLVQAIWNRSNVTSPTSGLGTRERGWISEHGPRSRIDSTELGALPEAQAKGVELRVVVDGDDPVDVDVRLIGSAIGNLMRKAVRYSSTGVIELRGRVANRRAIVEVEDCCGGLEPGKVESLFSPFVRLDQNQTGFGLGLAIAKQAVEAHDGTIRVQNLPTKGCVFVMEIPV